MVAICGQHGFAGRLRSRCILALWLDARRISMCAIAAALVLAQTVLSEPAMQHVGIDAMFTRCGGN